MAASMTDSATTCGAIFTLATRSPASTTEPSNAVKTSSGSSRLTRSSVATRRGARRRGWPGGRPGSGPARDVSGPAPATAKASRSAASSSCSSPGVEQDDRGATQVQLAPPVLSRSARVSRRPFDQRSPPTTRSARQDRPGERSGGRRPGDDPLESHAPGCRIVSRSGRALLRSPAACRQRPSPFR